MALMMICGCKTINSNLSIAELKLPSSFNSSKDTANIAKINWRNYFKDELLLNLIDTALSKNYDVQIALQKIYIARSGVRFAKSEMLPKVDGGIYAGLTRYGKFTESGQGNATTPYPDDPDKVIPNPVQDYYLGLTTTWEVDIWGRLKNQHKSAMANYLASIECKNFVVSNLVAEIAISYYELIGLDNELDIIRQTIQRQNDALNVAKIQKEAGRANDLAIQQFQSQLLNSKAEEREIMQQINEMENKINFFLSRFPQTIERKKDRLYQEMPTQISMGIPSQLLSYRPDIREAELQVQATRFDLNAAKAAFFPNFNIGATLGFQSFNPKFLLSTPASIGFSALGGMIAPLINKNAIKANFNYAQASQLTAMYNYQKVILNGYVEVSNELNSIDNLREINAYKNEQKDILMQSVETANELYKTGKANYIEVLLAQQNSLQTQLELIGISKRLRIATVNLYKALGGGWD